jgi:hypothetical protein
VLAFWWGSSCIHSRHCTSRRAPSSRSPFACDKDGHCTSVCCKTYIACRPRRSRLTMQAARASPMPPSSAPALVNADTKPASTAQPLALDCDAIPALAEQPLALDVAACTGLAEDLNQPYKLVAKFLLKHPVYQHRSRSTLAEKFHSIAEALEFTIAEVLLMATNHPGLLIQTPESLKDHMQQFQALLQLPERRVKLMFRTNPSLFGVSMAITRKKVAGMKAGLRLDDDRVRKMLCRRPALLQLSLTAMLHKAEMLAWMLGVTFATACNLAARCPSLLYMSTATLQSKVVALEAAFSGMSRADVIAMLVARPSVLTASVEKLEQRWQVVCAACSCSEVWQAQWGKYANSTRALILMKEQSAFERLQHLMTTEQYGVVPLSTLFTMTHTNFERRFCNLST